jgi:phenylpropionate dioxygenase-like ring-hydroxylating dioxygenase large terminal subunit
MSGFAPPSGYFTNLPREYYLSQEIFEQEMERVFTRQWLLVGHVSLAPRPGDYFVKQVGPESLILVRDDQDRFSAFFNVCRHRGFRICDKGEAGHTARLTCKYHAWTYDMSGALRAAPGSRNGADFDFAKFGLHHAWCDEYCGFIYVCLGKERPPALADVLRPMSNEDDLRRIDPRNLKLAHRETYVVNANWKALLENDMECHHCPTAHTVLTVACDYRGFYADSRSGAHFPLKAGMKTFSADGDWVCSKPLGADLPPQFSCGFLLWPNFCGPLFMADHCVSLETTPLSVDKTQLISECYVRSDTIEGVDYEVERLIKAFHVTNLEDAELAERNFEGMRSLRFVPGPLSATREDGTRAALATYLEMMGRRPGSDAAGRSSAA